MRWFLAMLLALAGLPLPVPCEAQPGITVTITPEHPTTRDFLRIGVSGGTSSCPLDWIGPGLSNGEIRLHAENAGDLDFPCPGPNPIYFEGGLGPLPAGVYPLRIDIQGWELPVQWVEVRAPDARLALYEGRFLVTAVFDPPGGGEPQPAGAVGLSPRSGYFWFFHPDMVELTVKLLDASAINGRFWFFLASLTNRGFRVTVMDVGDGTCLTLPVVPPACPTYTFESPTGVNRNILDFETIGS